MKKLNRNFKLLKDDYLFAEVGKRVEEYKKAFPTADVISLGIGDVTQPLSPKVVEAAKNAATELSSRATFRGYGPYDGYAFLKDAIVDYYKLRGVEINADEVFVTDGAKNGIGNILDLFESDATVMIPDPVYPAYVDANIIAGREIIYVNGTPENGFLPMPPTEHGHNHAKPDIIYLCSPNNPTGAAYTIGQLSAWVKYAVDNDAVILYDAAYEAFIENNEKDIKNRDDRVARSIFEVVGARDCAVELCSFSKLAGFTGVRCGWTVIPTKSPLNRMWLRRQAIKFNGTSYIVQRMAESALKNGYEETERLVSLYKSNAKLITDEFDKLGIEYTGGIHAPYVWFFTGIDSWEFFDCLLNKARIVCTPGSGFGKNCNGWVRITSFNTPERTKEAVERFRSFWQEFLTVREKLFSPIKK